MFITIIDIYSGLAGKHPTVVKFLWICCCDCVAMVTKIRHADFIPPVLAFYSVYLLPSVSECRGESDRLLLPVAGIFISIHFSNL